jgi:hypothetical protein
MRKSKPRIVLKTEIVLARLKTMMLANKIDHDLALEVQEMVLTGQAEAYECPENPMMFSLGVKCK